MASLNALCVDSLQVSNAISSAEQPLHSNLQGFVHDKPFVAVEDLRVADPQKILGLSLLDLLECLVST